MSNMITQYNIVYSYVKFLQDNTSIDAHWKRQGWRRLNTYPYYTVEYVNSNFTEKTKLSDLLNEDLFFTFGVHADNLSDYARHHAVLKELLLYRNIPLYDVDENIVGTFKVEDVLGEQPVMGGDEEEVSKEHRLYIDTRVSLTHVKAN